MLKYPEKSYGKVYKGEGNENIIGNRLLHLSVMINLAPSLLQQRLCKFCPVAQLMVAITMIRGEEQHWIHKCPLGHFIVVPTIPKEKLNVKTKSNHTFMQLCKTESDKCKMQVELRIVVVEHPPQSQF